MPDRRGYALMAATLALAGCSVTTAAGHVSGDAQLIAGAMRAIGETGPAMDTAQSEAQALSRQYVPTRLDVQSFVLAAQTLSRGAAAASAPTAASVADATNALLPAMAAAVDASAPATPASTLSLDQARLVLQAASGQAAAPAVVAPALPAPQIAAPRVVAPAAAPSPVASSVTSGGTITLRSRHGLAETLARLEAALREQGGTVLARYEIGGAGTIVEYADLGSNAAARRARPALALDLPRRILVRQEGGQVSLTGDAASEAAARRAAE